jgi:tetratricopeptide (TPR) repeat protein
VTAVEHVIARCLLTFVLIFTAACGSDASRAEYHAKGNEYFERKQYREALSMYRNALEKDRRAGDSYYRAGLAAIKLQQWEEAVRHLESAIELMPGNLDAHAKLADVYLFAYGAAPHLRKAIQIELLSLSSKLQERFPASYDSVRLLGFLASFSNDKASALKHLATANKLRPNDPDVAQAYAQALFSSGHAASGEEIAHRALEGRPDVLALYDVLFDHYKETSRVSDAESILRRKVTNNPHSEHGYLQLAAWYFATARHAEMRDVLKQIGDQSQIFPLAPMLIGDFYLRVAMFPLAMEQYQQIAQRGGAAKRRAQKRIVDVLVKQKKWAEAEQVVRMLRTEEPQDPEAIALEASVAAAQEGKNGVRAAVESFRSVLPQLPADFVLRYLYARALLQSGDVGTAAAQCEESLRLRPDYLLPRIVLADIALAADRIKDAHILFNSISENPGTLVPFDTAGQQPQEQPSYESILGIKPPAGDAIRRLNAELADKRRRLVETVGVQARQWEAPR